MVTIAILGIIAGMSFPMLRKLSEANQQKKYKVYAQSLNSSAKLYVDSYGEDLFGDSPYGCTTIYYKDLKDKLATKDIQTSNLSCNSKQTYVNVIKSHDNYSYYSQVGCETKKSNNSELSNSEVTVTYSLGKDTSCPTDDNSYKITTTPDSDETKTKKNIDVNVIINESKTGINKTNGSIDLKYQWVGTDKVVNENNWQEVKFSNIPANSKQEKEILKGNGITIKSNSISTPSGATGTYYLVVQQNTIYNIYMKDIVKTTDKKSTQIFGPFIIDNTPPVIENLSAKSSESTYNSTTPILNLKASDVLSDVGDLKICYSYDKDKCGKSNSDFNGSDYINYTETISLSKIRNKLDGSTHLIYVTVVDPAGNYVVGTTSYKLSQTYNLSIKDVKGGTVKASKSTPLLGESVSMTIKNKTDFTYQGATLKCNNGKTYNLSSTDRKFAVDISETGCTDAVLSPIWKRNDRYIFDVSSVGEWDGTKSDLKFTQNLSSGVNGYYQYNPDGNGYSNYMYFVNKGKAQMTATSTIDVTDYDYVRIFYSWCTVKKTKVYVGIVNNRKSWLSNVSGNKGTYALWYNMTSTWQNHNDNSTRGEALTNISSYSGEYYLAIQYDSTSVTDTSIYGIGCNVDHLQLYGKTYS